MAEYDEKIERSTRKSVLAYIATSMAVLLLMMVFGWLMRAEQSQFIEMGPLWFYQLLTLHGIGMVSVAGLAGAGIMWHFLSRHVELSERVFVANLVLFLVGVVMILGSVLIGKFHAAWTVLYPLPTHSMGLWSTGSMVLFLLGVLTVGVGFLLYHLDIARAVIARYGSLSGALGWPQLFGREPGYGPPPAVVASTMATIVNVVGLVAGASIAVMMIINAYAPAFVIDPLLAKNMIYFFGHVFINATIYMAVIAVYELLPYYTRRPWKSNRAFLASWTASTLMVLIIYPHHLLMDFVMPRWMLMMGHIISYLNTFPILVVTGYGGLMIVYRSGIKWDMSSRLLFISLFGWAAGAMPAFIDGTIGVNYVMHNTLWVPGHFHTYLLLGMMTMVFGFMYHVGNTRQGAGDGLIDRIAMWVFGIATLGFTLSFLYSGKQSVARRYAGHMSEWVSYDRVATVFATLLIAAALVFMLRFLSRLSAAAHEVPQIPLPQSAQH